MMSFEISKMQNPTTIGLFNVTLLWAPLTITKSGFIISLCLYDVLLTAFLSVVGSAMRRIFTLCLTCSMVLPKVAFACNFAKSDSKSDLTSRRCLLQRSIQGFNQDA